MWPTSMTRIAGRISISVAMPSGAICAIDNCIGVRVVQRGATFDPGRKFNCIGERTVLRHIGPDRVVTP